MSWVKVADGLPNDGEGVIAWDGTFHWDCVFEGGEFKTIDNRDEKLHALNGITHWLRIVPPNN